MRGESAPYWATKGHAGIAKVVQLGQRRIGVSQLSGGRAGILHSTARKQQIDIGVFVPKLRQKTPQPEGQIDQKTAAAPRRPCQDIHARAWNP